jgi:hypothetical protein
MCGNGLSAQNKKKQEEKIKETESDFSDPHSKVFS